MSDIIAIDGPASVGKSTIAKKISNTFHCPILYSGRLYRVIALEIVKRKISTKNKPAILECLNLIDKISLESKNLFSSEIDELSSIISKKKYIRDALKDLQRNFPKKYAKDKKYIVIEGRDIGTEIFPDAKYKIFMWADAKIRARRRYKQILKKGGKPRLSKIYNEIIKRDKNDLGRKIAPLKPAVNSVLLDTTYLDIEQSFNVIKNIISD